MSDDGAVAEKRSRGRPSKPAEVIIFETSTTIVETLLILYYVE